MAHLRYPEDLFKIQRWLLAEYHVTNPTTWYGVQERWAVPNDPSVNRAELQPPYYQTIQMPDADAAFSLTTTYVPARAAEPGCIHGRQRRRSKRRLRHDSHPSTAGNTQIAGPGQVANDFETDPDVARELSLLRQGEAETITGNLLTLPVGGGLLYVQPVYVQRATGDAAYPLLQRVLVSFGNEIGYAATLQEALDQIFQGESGAETEEPPATEAPTPPPTTAPPPPPTPPPTGEGGTDLQVAIADAQQAYSDAQAAQRDGDWAAYGEALERLEEALARAASLSGESTPAP